MELWNIGGAASHEIAVKDTKNALVSNDEEIVLLPLQFQDDRFKANCKIMIGLGTGQRLKQV